jgi:hypothetical protein
MKALWRIGRGLFFLSLAAPGLARAADVPPDGLSLDKLGDCNWRVTYRGRIYDLSPLTREALSRPIENDIRFALQRVPEASEHLARMDKRLRAARTHTVLASVFISSLLVTRLLRSRDNNEKNFQHYRALSWGFGGMFAMEALFSLFSTKAAKHELVHAVEEFNAHSSYKIEPAVGGTAIDSPISGGMPATP